MPPITDSHSLFATSSAPYTVAVTYASVAALILANENGDAWGLPRFLMDPTGWQPAMGLGTFYPPHVFGEPIAIDDKQWPTWCLLWLQLLNLH